MVAPIPHVVAWNLTQRCNLACAHCYIAAGSWHSAANDLTTDECLRITDEIIAVNPSPMFILSGGEPLLRKDLETIAEYGAQRGATVTIGTNATMLTRGRIRSLKSAGVQGVAVSIDSLNDQYHDRFRHGSGALQDTLAAVELLREEKLDFIVQTSLTRGNRDELATLAAWAAERGAVSFNVYFLVATGRGEGMEGLSPEENDEVLQDLIALEHEYHGRMLVRSKCQPQIMRFAHQKTQSETESAQRSSLLNYATRCPCGVTYCRITPEGKLTPCPYTPVVAGDLRKQSFGDVWRDSELFAQLRSGAVTGKCGRCEYKEVCGGCRARAYAKYNDILAQDDSCSYQPTGDREVVLAPAVAYGTGVQTATMIWSDEARKRLDRIPSFVRFVVMHRIEDFARDHGFESVTPEVMQAVRAEMPIDFSKRKPFFMKSWT